MTPLALQVWDFVGWGGQACFFARMLSQWLASERAGRSIVPRSFWWWSLAGTVGLLIYETHRADPVFLIGIVANLAIYARNLFLPPEERAHEHRRLPRVVEWSLVLSTIALYIALIVLRPSDRIPGGWLALGLAMQAIWSTRFLVQWISSERKGHSHMPAAFWWMSIVGSVGLFAYAVERVDWVMMFGMGLNFIPYIRNLVLLGRENARTSEMQQAQTGEATRNADA